MIFSIQRYLEDLFERRGLRDPDQYAVKLANFYDQSRQHYAQAKFVQDMARIRTSFFKANTINERTSFDKELLRRLDGKFLKKKAAKPDSDGSDEFPGGLRGEQRRLKPRRKSVSQLLFEFGHAIEARAVDSFWKSRKAARLRSRPEDIGQSLLALFLKGVLGKQSTGFILREAGSGIGFVDIVLVLSSVPHLIELKILKSTVSGASQLATYMRSEKRRCGWLVIFDARPVDRKTVIPSREKTPAGTVNVVVIDINPAAPSLVKPANQRRGI